MKGRLVVAEAVGEVQEEGGCDYKKATKGILVLLVGIVEYFDCGGDYANLYR